MVNAHPIQEARRRSMSMRPTTRAGMCKREVRECLGVAVSRSDDAQECWDNAKVKHHETDPRKIPRGAPVFWSGGSSGHGHVALATGFHGECFSTDIKRSGYFDKVPIQLIEEKWGLTLLGWTEDFDGVRVMKDRHYDGTLRMEAGASEAKDDQEPHPAVESARPPAKKTPAAKKATAKKGTDA